MSISQDDSSQASKGSRRDSAPLDLEDAALNAPQNLSESIVNLNIGSTAASKQGSLPSIYQLEFDELREKLAEWKQPSYRAKQVWRWLYKDLVQDFESMSNLPAGLRSDLARSYRLASLKLVESTGSRNSPAQKFLFGLGDSQMIETVLMADGESDVLDEETEELDVTQGESEPVALSGSSSRRRYTVCLSTQSGCAMGCVFCATGQMGLLCDLDAGECIEQVLFCARKLALSGERLSNIVFMGMGEPLANWPATWATIQRLTDPEAFGMSARRLTVSTVGIVPGIERIAECGLPVRLAVSLHAPDDALRSSLVAVNSVYDLDSIFKACRAYQAQGGRRITFEYVLIDGVNDAWEQAALLAQRIKGIHCHFNLIPLNPTEGSRMRPSRPERALAFKQCLVDAGYPCTLRMRRGIDIQAGCGQLRTRAEAGRLGRSIPIPLADSRPD